VPTAKEALMPPAGRRANDHAALVGPQRHRRKNAAHRRQGEWFFIPEPDLNPPPECVLFHEPLRRGQGKPHMAECLYRAGGTAVYACSFYPQGRTESELAALFRLDPSARGLGWRPLRLNPVVYVRGAMRHPDHRTLILRGWHRVLPNTEHRAPASQHLAFID
jgi:hypothetical protein